VVKNFDEFYLLGQWIAPRDVRSLPLDLGGRDGCDRLDKGNPWEEPIDQCEHRDLRSLEQKPKPSRRPKGFPLSSAKIF
jgi:hypothetical protein